MAIWVTPKLSSLPDVGISSPQDGHVLTYDSGTGEWVNEALPAGVTDHGALTGLADDDHTGYLLATGSRTGASAAAQPFTVGITLTDTTTATTGVIFKGALRFAHNFHHPTGGTVVPHGHNTFVGINSGNFTMGSTSTNEGHGSYNAAVGFETLSSLTTGGANCAFGYQSLKWVTTGGSNLGMGSLALLNCTTGAANTCVGVEAGYSIGTANYNVAIGFRSLHSNTAGNTVAIGTFAGRFQADGSTGLTSTANSVYIGYDSRGLNNSDSNSIVIGYQAISMGANTTVIGNTSTTGIQLYGAETLYHSSGTNNAVVPMLTIDKRTTWEGQAGFGSSVDFKCESSTTNTVEQARIVAVWNTATHATRKADLILTAYDTAEREGLRIRGNGSAAAIGFLGATPSARKAHVADPAGGATVDAEARAAINSILSTLETFGFHATS